MMKWPQSGHLNWALRDPLSHYNWIRFPWEISNKDFLLLKEAISLEQLMKTSDEIAIPMLWSRLRLIKE